MGNVHGQAEKVQLDLGLQGALRDKSLSCGMCGLHVKPFPDCLQADRDLTRANGAEPLVRRYYSRQKEEVTQ